MQFSKILVSAFAAVAAAAPAISQESTQVEKRSLLGGNELLALNNLNFGIDQFAYLSSINAFNSGLFDEQLFALNQRGFDVNIFQQLFQAQSFNVQNILLLNQLQMLVHFSQLGVFSNINLAGAQLFPTLDFGVLNDVFSLDLNQFIIDQTVITQVQTIAASSGLFGGIGFKE